MAQHVQTPKEQCFQAACEALQEVRKDTGLSVPEVYHQRIWTRARVNGKAQWRLESEDANFGSVMGSILKTLRLADMPEEAEAVRRHRWGTEQMRFPDVTVVRPDGKRVVIDCKFDRKDGTRDQWGTKPGLGSGQDQKTDYNEINNQEIGKPGLGLSLDADACMCPPGKEQKRVDEGDPNFAQDWAGDFVDNMKGADAENQPVTPPFIGPPPPPIPGPWRPPEDRPPGPWRPPPPPPRRPPPPPVVEDDEPTEDEPDPYRAPPPSHYPPRGYPGMGPSPIFTPAPGGIVLPAPGVAPMGPIFEPIFAPAL